MAKRTEQERGFKWLRYVIVPVIIAIVAVIANLPPSPPGSWQYVGHVIGSDTEKPVRGAKVSLEFQDVPPVIYTDSEGVFRFPVPKSDLPGRVKVEATGYQTYDRSITLSSKNPLEDIRLVPLSSTLASTLVPSPTLTPTPTPTPCFCQSATGDDTLRCLINAESEAANKNNLTLIQQIFAHDATIFRGDTRKTWDAPIAYYTSTFASLKFTEAKHFDIRQIEITAQVAKYTSGSSGYYAEPGATPTPYDNKNPSEHWVFGKNDRGCWVITRFEFNASHIKFP